MDEISQLNDREHLKRLEREWRIQHVGWIAMVVLVLATALGLLGGGGPFDVRIAGEEGAPIWIEYPHMARVETPATLRVHLLGEEPEGRVSFWLASAYLEHVEMRRVMPEPESVSLDPERVTFTFVATADRPIGIEIVIQPDDPGLLRMEMGRPGGDSVRFTQMVLP